jgi:membrane protein
MAVTLDQWDAERKRTRSPEARLWAAALTAVLLAAGFRPQRFSGPAEDDRNSTNRQDVPERGRGRSADKPSDIPAPGWKDILLRVYRDIGEDRVIALAAGVTFYSILALFPAIAALVSLYGLFADPASIATHLERLSGILPDGALQVIGDEIQRIASRGSATLGVTFVVGLATALWSANAGMKSIFDALNIVYDEEEKRSFIRLNAISLLFTIGAIVFVLVAIGVTVVLPLVLNFFGVTALAEFALRFMGWPALLLVVMLVLALLYRFGPSRARPKWRWISWGGASAAVLWLIASILFSWYAANFGSYSKTYGSLGAAIGFMVWIWLSTIVVLVGAELNAEIEHQSARDTTTGAPKPFGSRGARMADEVGPAQAEAG